MLVVATSATEGASRTAGERIGMMVFSDFYSTPGRPLYHPRAPIPTAGRVF